MSTKAFILFAVLSFSAATLTAQEKTMFIVKEGKTTHEVVVSDIDSIIFYNPDPSTVDEGVRINGIKWATRNVAAPGYFASSPEDAGMFYQWNRTTGWSTTNPITSTDGSSWDGSWKSGSTAWSTSNNVCPYGWRIPNREEIQNLATVNSEWVTTANGVIGRKFSNGDNTLFLPAAGHRLGTTSSLDLVDSYGYYWSSYPINSLGEVLLINSAEVISYANVSHSYGLNVRCVADIDYKFIRVANINLNKTAHTFFVSEDYLLKASVTPVNAIDRVVTWTSGDNSKVTVDSNGKITAIAAGTTTITATASGKTATCTVTVKVVSEDGVMINGVVWAKYNVDAPGKFAAKPEDPGMFYQWNRKTAWPATGDVTGWDNNTAGTTWEKANDPSPDGWRVPTRDEILSLLDTDKVTNEWITQNEVDGRIFTDKDTGNSIFLPAAGFRNGNTLSYVGLNGRYWSSTQYSSIASGTAICIYFNNSTAMWNTHSRTYGDSVRCVAE
jgi:uncharacterized protein (TIGR02145 family)